MQISAIVRFDGSFDYYVPTEDAEGTISYVFKATRSALLIPGVSGNVNLLTRDAMQIDSVVKNLRDRAGTEVLVEDGQSYTMAVKTASPVFNTFGMLEGWSHTLKRDGALDALIKRLNGLADALPSQLSLG